MFALAAGILAVNPAPTWAQSTKMPATLRYGTGYIDVPDATVLPHLSALFTYSGFLTRVDSVALTDDSGRVVGFGESVSDWRQDVSLAMGLFERLEVGATLQNFSGSDSGGTQAGAFGRVALLRPRQEGLGLAVGARYVSGPSFDGAGAGRDYQPPRLGFPDPRFYSDYGEGSSGAGSGEGDVHTKFSPYAVATLMLKGPDASWMLPFDFTVSAGWGDGMFRSGRDLAWYAGSSSNGWIFGSAIHMEVSEKSLLNLVADYNGFDANVGAQFDWSGVRLGAYVLGVNHLESTTEYRSPKLGASVSLAFCGLSRCVPELMEFPVPDTVRMPAPPPDTVIVGEGARASAPAGSPRDICLSTGRSHRVYVAPSGELLVGPDRIAVSELEGMVFEGTYAEGERWFTAGDAIPFEARIYRKSGREVRLVCENIMRVGEHEGVRLFADADADKPYLRIYVPVRPDVWQAYWAGLPGG